MITSFDELLSEHDWEPIRGCPGRYVLRGGRRDLSVEELLGGPAEVSEHGADKARDRVLVARLSGGGVISYKREDGSFLHTLNTEEGFRRKLLDLGVAPTDEPAAPR
jgi:hypothetical protein